jgi:beta-fructofuranosidase
MRGLGGADAGWASALSIPHVLSVAEGRLHLSPHPDLAARLEAEPERDATSGVLTRSLQWSPNSGDRLELRDASGVVTTSVRAADTALLLERSGLEAQSMPFSGGDVVLLVDGPAIEIWADGCILGGAIEPAAEIVEVPASADPSGAVREPSAAEA